VVRNDSPSLLARLGHGLLVAAAALLFTAALFLTLPLLEAIAEPPEADLIVTEVATADVPPPPPPPEEEEQDEEEPPPPPPPMTVDAPPLDLSQLEMALAPVSGDGWGIADPTLSLSQLLKRDDGGGPTDDPFDLDELEQKPRAIYQPSPALTAELRKKAPAKVVVVFFVNPEGRVEEPKVLSSSDPSFEKSALNAVKQWKFEPVKQRGQAARHRMKVPISF
jgi:protein TonB